ncbi:Dynein light chain Tctex-type [Mactra antiquata]
MDNSAMDNVMALDKKSSSDLCLAGTDFDTISMCSSENQSMCSVSTESTNITKDMSMIKTSETCARSVDNKSVMSDSGVSFNSRSDLSESCISSSLSESHDDKMLDLNSDVKREIEEKGNSSRGSREMVETEAGFYWLTCSIEEDHNNDVNVEWNGIVNDNVSETINIDLVSKCVDESGLESEMIEKSEEQQSENVGIGENYRSVDDYETNISNMESSSSSVNSLLSNCENQINDETDEKDKDNVNKENVNFLSLPKLQSKLNLSTPELSNTKKGNQENQIDIENSVRNLLKRKYSCPPNALKVFKIVSINIPEKSNAGRTRPKSSEQLKLQSSKTDKETQSQKQFSEPKSAQRHSLESGLPLQKDTLSPATHANREIKRHSYESGTKPKPCKEKKRSSDSVLCHKNHNDVLDNICFEPPAMFRDKPSTELENGPILKPPPGFDSDVNGSVMTTQHLPPPVWDPGASPSNCNYSRDRRTMHTPTLPPPPVEQSENIISDTLNQHKQRKLSGDSNCGFSYNKFSDTARRKSFDSGITSEYAEIDFDNVSSSSRLDVADTLNQDKNIKPGSKCKLKGEFKGQKEHVNKDQNSDITATELTKMLDLIESYTKCSDHDNFEYEKNMKEKLNCSDDKVLKNYHFEDGKGKTVAKFSKKDIIEEQKNDEKVTPNITEIVEDDTSAIYATVDKNRPRKPTPEKMPPSPVSNVPPPIPPKPKFLSENLDKKHSNSNIDNERSSELQVMFNSLSPVLLRRSNTARPYRKIGSSTETSPESTPSVSPREMKLNAKMNGKTTDNKKAKNDPSESLFMDPEMSKTWHGATSSDWTQYYGPQMKAMMKELNQLTYGTESSKDDTTDGSHQPEDTYDSRSKTLPSKSLLDQMHKKFCSDQYSNEKDAELARALVLFRLKSQQPTAKTRRSQSFNIRMGTGSTSYLRQGMSTIKPGTSASSSSTSSDSSPMFPRATERLRIKTRPDVQYSPKPGRARGVTPEPIPTKVIIEAKQTQKEEAEIEAIEACRWLRETGFPQYAQLYEDGQFPVDIDSVEKDHDFLDKEDIQSLFRRLNTLNKCAIMKIGTPTKKESEESDEEDPCALSDKWKYQRSSRRWSRKDLEGQFEENKNGEPVLKSASSHDSLLADQNSSSETGDSPVLDSKMLHTNEDIVFKTVPTYDANGNATMGISPNVIRRAASDRIKGAKSFLKRMESLKGKRSRKNKTITEISGPVITNNADMQAKIKHLNCRDINSTPNVNTVACSETPAVVNGEHGTGVTLSNSTPELITSPRREALTVVTSPEKGDKSSALNNTNSSAYDSDVSNSTINTSTSFDVSGLSTNGALNLDLSALSQQSNSSDNTSSSQETLYNSGENRVGKFPTLLDDSLFANDINVRTRSFSYADDNTAKDSKKSRRGSHDPRKQSNRISIYDNVPIEEDLATAQEELDIILSELFQNINGLNKAINGENAELLQPPSPLLLDDSSVSTDSQPGDTSVNTAAVADIDENEVISGTLSSPDISDHEIQTEDMSHDDSAEHIVVRERRDSGVGSSLTRTNSERRKYRIRWHSFQKSHRPTSESRNLQLSNLSAGQILVLRKLSLLKLTALIEKYAPNRSGWSLTVPRFMKRNKVPDYKDKNVFGVPFYVMIQRTGQALPQCILHAMRFLRRTGGDALGIFRKSGVRSRIQKLRNDMEADPESVDFNELQAYDVADLVKQYFRELPECLLTNKLSDIFISIFVYVPLDLRLEALQAAVVLMTDENRDVLQSLLLFLSDIAKHASTHQMTASNLAVCFAPSLFNMGGVRNPSQTPSPRRNRKNPGIPDARELMEQKAAHECLTVMINECKKLFTIPSVTLSKCRILHEDPVTLEELNKHTDDGHHGYMAHIESCIQGLLKESREKFRGWVSVSVLNDVDVSYKKVGDGHPLRLWKCTVDVEAPPNEVLNRVLNDRQKWDEDLLQWNTVEKLDKQTEVFQYVRNSMAPHPTRDYCVLRSWKTDLPKGACVLISTSIEHDSVDILGGIRAVELASRYLIEPCGTGKSRLTHISRVDMRGHSPEWYKKVYGHICANFMDRIRASFHCSSDGPETKV